LSRENTYSQLLEAVTDEEKQKENLKLENEKLGEELRIKSIELDGLRGNDEESPLFKLQKEIADLNKNEQSLLEKYQRCSIVFDRLRNWVLKIYKILLSVLEKSNQHAEELKLLRSLDMSNTETMFVQMCGIMEKLIEKYGHSEGEVFSIKALVGQDAFYEDEDYKQKNIRVRPTTKPALKREDSFRSSQGAQSVSPAQTTAVAESEKEQREINSEFRDERRKIKTEMKKNVITSYDC
jgi:hypothetical protein